MPYHHEIYSCRACTSTRLTPVLNLGEIALSAFLSPSEPDSPKSPIELVLCETCSLLQLKHYVDPDLHFREFHYRSGLTQTMREALLNVVESCRARCHLRSGDTVLDIGSNDSTLLSYWDSDLERIGFEPATNLMEDARLPDLVIVNDYFTYKGLRGVTGKKAKVITAIACFYDIGQINAFCDDVRKSLANDGLFCIQLMSLSHMLESHDVGNLTQEHLTHWSLLSLEQLLETHGLYVWDCESNGINGGSLRVYCSPELKLPTASLVMQRHHERRSKFHLPDVYKDFADACEFTKQQIQEYVGEAARDGRRLLGLGASTKGNLMVDYWGIRLPAVSERDSRKLGKVMSAGRIPIITEQEARDQADEFLVFPYSFREEIVKRECGWLKQGGRLIFPLPTFEIVNSCGGC